MNWLKKDFLLKASVVLVVEVLVLFTVAYVSFSAGAHKKSEDDSLATSYREPYPSQARNVLGPAIEAGVTKIVGAHPSSTIWKISNGDAEVTLAINPIPGIATVSSSYIAIRDDRFTRTSANPYDHYSQFYPIPLLKMSSGTVPGLQEYIDEEANIRFLYPTGFGEIQKATSSTAYTITGGNIFGPKFFIKFSESPLAHTPPADYLCRIRLAERVSLSWIEGCFFNQNRDSLVGSALVMSLDNDAGYEFMEGYASLPISERAAYGHPKFGAVVVRLEYPADIQLMLRMLDSIKLARGAS